MRLRTVLTVLVVALFATQPRADMGISPEQKSGLQIPITQGLQGAGGLLDLKKFQFNQTLGMTYSSSQGGGLSQYYLNDITYQISKPLVVRAQVGVANNLSQATHYGSTSGVQLVVPSISVLYQPKPNLLIEFGFSNMPNYYGFYAPR